MSFMVEKSLLILLEGSDKIGYGHFYRGIAVAERLIHNFKIYFLVESTSDFEKILKITNLPNASVLALKDNLYDLRRISSKILVDGYSFGDDFFSILKKQGLEVIYVDDYKRIYQNVDKIINHNQAIKKSDYKNLPSTTKLFLGFNYLLIRQDFLNEINKPLNLNRKNDVLILPGGTDAKNISEVIIEELLVNKNIANIHIVRKSRLEKYDQNSRVFWHNNLNSSELITLIKSCKFALTTASTVSIECCLVGVNLITFYIVDNQKDTDEFLALSGLSKTIGDFFENYKEINNLIDEFMIERTKHIEYQKNYLKQFDFNKLLDVFEN